MNQQITIPDLDDRVVQRLKQLAWQNSMPLEELLRSVLIEAAYSRKAALRPPFPASHDGASDRPRRLLEPSV